jgi:uncharacterized membrane-anchored protein YhcB (DUF1043 family)
MSSRGVIGLAIAALLVGIVVGYLVWSRPPRDVARELADTRARLSTETQRADALQKRVEDVQRRLGETEGELRRAGEGLMRERQAREKLEELVSKERK